MKLLKALALAAGFVVLLSSVLNPAQALQLDAGTKEKLKQEIDYVSALYGSTYAPKAWKESHLGWDLPAQVVIAQTKLAAATNIHDAREAVVSLIRSTADYHVGYSFYSTESATLPFQVKTIQNKSLIVFIDRAKLSATSFPFEVGDEVLLIEQTPVAKILSDIMTELGSNVKGTDLALADLYLTRRAGRLNFKVPQGPVMVSVKRAIDDKVGTVQLAWNYTPEKLNNWEKSRFSLARNSQNTIFTKKMISSLASEFASNEPNRYGLGGRESFLPDFGIRTWKSEETNAFDAYTYQNDAGQVIGVVRIPGYQVDDYVKAGIDFAAIIEKFEKETVALVIDQNNNPGGSVFYLYNLASMLSDKPLAVPHHRISLTPGEASECLTTVESLALVQNDEDAAKALGSLHGYPVTYQLALAVRDYCNSVIAEYQAGQSLSSALPLWGVEKINPNKIHYTKPIVILVNQLDFSGGDFFPAIMQDNNRATIVGTRTAGAGGYVNEAKFPNIFGLEYISFTGSIAERVDANPIENLGVTPDVKLPISVEDIRNNYKAYQAKVSEVVTKLIK